MFPNTPVARQWWSDWFRISADDVVTCLDAATGKTLWETVFPMRNTNEQTHKWRGYFGVPLVADGVVYVGPNMMGRVYALDATTGKQLWEYPAPPVGEEQGGGDDGAVAAPSPVLADGVLIVNGVLGLDAKTGVRRWGRTGTSGVFFPITLEGKVMVLGVGSREIEGGRYLRVLEAFNPANGRKVWELRDVESMPAVPYPLLVGDRLLTISTSVAQVPQATSLDLPSLDGDDPGVRKAQPATAAPATQSPDKDDEEGAIARANVVHCYVIKTDGARKLWDGPPLEGMDPVMVASTTHVYAAGTTKAQCLDLATGKEVGSTDGICVHRTPAGMLAEGRLIIQPEGRHGITYFQMAHADPSDFRTLRPCESVKYESSVAWVPPHPPTTAYAVQPLNYPVVDGRIFIRGRDAIYCYDLRASAAARKVDEAVRGAGRDAAKVAAALAGLGTDPDPEVRLWAGFQLADRVANAQAGEPTPALSTALAGFAVHPNRALATKVSQAFLAMGPECLPHLLTLARGENVAGRRLALQTVGQFGTNSDARISEVLSRGLGDPDPLVLASALKGVEGRGPAAVPHLPELIRLVDEAPPAQGVGATRALLMVLPPGQKPAVVPKTYAAKLTELMVIWGEDEMLKRVLAAIGALGDDEAYRIGVQVLNGNDPLRGIRACQVLATLGVKAVPAIPMIEQAKAKWPSGSFQKEADAALGRIRNAK
jgi:outer membrane protein assembly factor BamB